MNRNNEGNLTEKAPSAKNGKPDFRISFGTKIAVKSIWKLCLKITTAWLPATKI